MALCILQQDSDVICTRSWQNYLVFNPMYETHPPHESHEETRKEATQLKGNDNYGIRDLLENPWLNIPLMSSYGELHGGLGVHHLPTLMR